MTRTQTQIIDDVLAGTFPASDPPAWTPGMARPAPEAGTRSADGTGQKEAYEVRADVIDVSRPTRSQRTFANGIVSLIGASGLAVLVPLAIIVVWTLAALALHGLLEAGEWLLAMING
jgi:hypothetical protein